MELGNLLSTISIFVAIISVAVALWIWKRQNKKKSLSYRIITLSSLLTINTEISDKIKILFNSKPIKNIKLLIIKVFNSGDIPIAMDDYEEPLSLEFSNDTRILEAEIINREPEHLPISITQDRQRITLEPKLMNSKESVTIKVLFTGSDEFLFTGRVLGISNVEEYTDSQNKNAFMTWEPLFTAFAIVALAIAVWLSQRNIKEFQAGVTFSIYAPSYPCTVLSGQQIPLTLIGMMPPNAVIDWSADKGAILTTPPGLNALYTAPKVTVDTAITITVDVKSGTPTITSTNQVPCTVTVGE